MKRSFIMIAVLGFLLCGCMAMAQRGALNRAYSNYQKGDYEDVLELTSQAESYKEPTREMKAEILFLKALSLEKLERYEEAQGTFKYLSDKFNDTEYGYRAKEKIK
jgi:TolA-binding protein